MRAFISLLSVCLFFGLFSSITVKAQAPTLEKVRLASPEMIFLNYPLNNSGSAITFEPSAFGVYSNDSIARLDSCNFGLNASGSCRIHYDDYSCHRYEYIRCPNSGIAKISFGSDLKLEKRFPSDTTTLYVVQDVFQLSFQDSTVAEGTFFFCSISADNLRIPNQLFNWRIQEPSIAKVDSTGKVRTIKSGTTTIEVLYGDSIVATSKLTVNDKKISGVTLFPQDTSILLGNTINYQLVGTYSSAKIRRKYLTTNKEKRRIPNQYIEWQVADTNVATINKQGVLTPKKTGATTLFATYGTSEVSSTNLYVCSMDLQPEDTTILKGDSIRYRLIGSFPPQKEGRNNVTKSATWSVSNANANFSSSTKGLLNTNAVGNTTISASYDGFQKNTSLTILDSIITVEFPTDTSLVQMRQIYNYRDVGLKISIQTLDTLIQLNTKDSIPGLRYTLKPIGNVMVDTTRNSFNIFYGGFAKLSARYAGIEASVVLKAFYQNIDVSFSPKNLNDSILSTNDTIQLKVMIDGKDYNYDRDISFRSSNPEIASVDKNGRIITRGYGKAIIYMHTTGWSEALQLRVFDLRKIALTPTHPLLIHQNKQINAYAISKDGDSLMVNSSIDWSSSNPLVLSISQKGNLEAKMEGNAQITASLSGRASESISVNVFGIDSLTSIFLTSNSSSILVGDSVQLKAWAIMPNGDSLSLNQNVRWVTSNPNAISINENGMAKVMARGSAKVYVNFDNHYSDTISIKGVNALTSLKITTSKDTLAVLEERSLNALGYYQNGGQKNLTDSIQWSVNDPSKAILRQDHRILAIAKGAIKVMGKYQGVTDSLEFQVEKELVNTIAVTTPDTILLLGVDSSLQYECKGVFSLGQKSRSITDSVQWSVSDTNLARIDSSGLLRPLGEGTIVITAKYALPNELLNSTAILHLKVPKLEMPDPVKLLVTGIYCLCSWGASSMGLCR